GCRACSEIESRPRFVIASSRRPSFIDETLPYVPEHRSTDRTDLRPNPKRRGFPPHPLPVKFSGSPEPVWGNVTLGLHDYSDLLGSANDGGQQQIEAGGKMIEIALSAPFVHVSEPSKRKLLRLCGASLLVTGMLSASVAQARITQITIVTRGT